MQLPLACYAFARDLLVNRTKGNFMRIVRGSECSLRAFAFLLLTCLGVCAPAQTAGEPKLPAEARAKIDGIVQQALKQTGVPSVSIAVVKDGEIAYVRAYGVARLEPPTAARPEMRYSIGSISKQFTAAAILLLA